jgi:FlaA1/EpsC-like NDP-sugar epimerase
MNLKHSFRPSSVARGIRNRHLFLLDIILITLSVWLSFAMRLDTLAPMKLLPTAMPYLALVLLVRMAMLYAMGIYQRYWLYASVEEMALLALAIAASTAVIVALTLGVLLPLGYLDGLPRSVPLIGGLVTLFLIGGSRFTIRVLGSQGAPSHFAASADAPLPVLIAGAGEAGGIIARELVHNPQLGLQAVGLVDDDPAKQGVRVHGLPVLGTCRDLPWLIAKYEIGQVIIAMPTAPGTAIRHIREACHKAGAKVRTMPGIYEILSGQVGLQLVRDVQIEDLLRREPIQADEQALRGYLYRRRVAVTGAGGSIGGELCRQIAAVGPGLLLLVGHGENSIFEIEQELRRKFPTVPVQPVIADIRDAERMAWIFRTWKPQIVFHAAAHKHVPLMEDNVIEAVTNNVLGTRNVVRAAEAAGVERLVMISTDKAVCPTSVMGATKRIAEMVIQEAAKRTARPYVAVRFGNVLGSRGSVIPVFKEQIKAGGPVTVTHPEMTRYFMTIPEAVHLVLQAGVLGAGGETFVLDMGRPVKVLDLAADLIELSGLKPHEDVEIIFTGVRPGEKLHESLFCPDEVQAVSAHEKILVGRNGHAVSLRDLDAAIARLEQLARQQREADILEVFRHILPDYRAAGADYPPAADGRQPAPAPGLAAGLHYLAHKAD